MTKEEHLAYMAEYKDWNKVGDKRGGPCRVCSKFIFMEEENYYFTCRTTQIPDQFDPHLAYNSSLMLFYHPHCFVNIAGPEHSVDFYDERKKQP